MQRRTSNILIAAMLLLLTSLATARADDLFDSGRGGSGAGSGSGTGPGGLYERGHTYERVESEVDRGTGRIVDPQTHELDLREQRQRDDLSAADQFRLDQDRADRIAARERRQALERRWQKLIQQPARRPISSLPPVFSSPLLSWIIESAEIATSQPASAPADR